MYPDSRKESTVLSLEQWLLDADAAVTCKHLIECYNSDLNTDILKNPVKICSASSSFISSAAVEGTNGFKASLDHLTHAISVVNSLRNKAILNNTCDIVNIFDEADEFTRLISGASVSLKVLKEGVDSKYGRLVKLYEFMESRAKTLERLHKVISYVFECKILVARLQNLTKEFAAIGDSLEDFIGLVKIAYELSKTIQQLENIESTDVSRKCIEHSNSLRSSIVKSVLDKGVMPIFNETYGISPNSVTEKMLIISHCVLKQLSVDQSCVLQLVDSLVCKTSDCINLKQVVSARTHENDWQQFFLSQFSEFMAKYKHNLSGLYMVCSCSQSNFLDKLDKAERQMLKSYYLIESDTGKSNPKEIFSFCEMYFERCIGLLRTALSHLKDQKPGGKYFDVSMISPQLILLGESTHAELAHLSIPFDLSKYYFKTICEDYVKEFLIGAAKDIVTRSKHVFADCVDMLPQNSSNSDRKCYMNSLSDEQQLILSSILLAKLPTNIEVMDVMCEYLERSRCCESLHRHIQSTVVCGLQNIFDHISQIATNSGSRLILHDSGSKIVLRQPCDAHRLNSRLYQLVHSITSKLEAQFYDSLDESSQLGKMLKLGRELELINNWSDDVGATMWHTVSYISAGSCDEFGWTSQQVQTATKNIIKVCNFLRESYFDPLVPLGRPKLFGRLSVHAVSTFIVYAISTWPLEEEEKMSFLNLATELEIALSEILGCSLPKREACYLASLRRLVFLGGSELFDLLKSRDYHSEANLWLPDDVMALHIIVRVIKNPGLPSDVRSELSKSPLYKFLGFDGIHTMMQPFRDSILNFHDANDGNTYSRSLLRYLQQFESLKDDIEQTYCELAPFQP